MRSWPLMLISILAVTTAKAADENNQFSIRGAGLLTCKAFVEERAKQSPAYLMIGGWIDGYITGVNQYAPQTYDATPFETTEMLMLIIDRHCQQNPDDLLYPVANSILIRLQDQRLQTNSPFQIVRVGDYQTRLYQAVIRRIQANLSQLGHLDAPVSETWDEPTTRALAAYQSAKSLEATGFPDQITLWRLFSDNP